MNTIEASVGKGGVNHTKDVKTVQKLLNARIGELGLSKKLVEDGSCGPITIDAIILFQKKIVKLSLPDGRIDPGGKSWTALTKAKFLPLPKSSHYYSYKDASTQYGTANTLASIAKAAKLVKAELKVQLAIGQLSLENGGAFGGHVSHQKGVDVDLRPLRDDDKPQPTNISDDSYSSKKTAKLVEILLRDANLELILFNDKNIKGVKYWAGHDDHLHVRYKS